MGLKSLESSRFQKYLMKLPWTACLTMWYVLLIYQMLLTSNDCIILQYNWTLSTQSSPTVQKFFAFVKARLPTALETKFAEFPAALLETHGKDLQVGTTPNSAEPSRTGTPAPASAPVASSSVSKAQPSTSGTVKVVKEEKKPLNTKTVTVEATFMAAAEDLFQMMTDESKIPVWTRAPAQVSHFNEKI